MLVLSNHHQSKKPPFINLHNDHDEHLDCAPRVLLVEDNPIIQIAMLGILQEHSGYNVEVANTGEEAITLFSKGFDLVIMDVGLPGIDGIEATKEIRKLYPSANTPIVAHTSHGNETVKQQCLEAGMNNYLTKGDSLETLEGVIAGEIAAQKKCVNSMIV